MGAPLSNVPFLVYDESKDWSTFWVSESHLRRLDIPESDWHRYPIGKRGIQYSGAEAHLLEIPSDSQHIVSSSHAREFGELLVLASYESMYASQMELVATHEYGLLFLNVLTDADSFFGPIEASRRIEFTEGISADDLFQIACRWMFEDEIEFQPETFFSSIVPGLSDALYAHLASLGKDIED